jgi:hypothetical protein
VALLARNLGVEPYEALEGEALTLPLVSELFDLAAG